MVVESPPIIAFLRCEKLINLHDVAVCNIWGVAPQFSSLGCEDGVCSLCVKVLNWDPCVVVVDSKAGFPALDDVLV